MSANDSPPSWVNSRSPAIQRLLGLGVDRPSLPRGTARSGGRSSARAVMVRCSSSKPQAAADRLGRGDGPLHGRAVKGVGLPRSFRWSASRTAWCSPQSLRPMSDSAPWKMSGAEVSAWRINKQTSFLQRLAPRRGNEKDKGHVDDGPCSTGDGLPSSDVPGSVDRVRVERSLISRSPIADVATSLTGR